MLVSRPFTAWRWAILVPLPSTSCWEPRLSNALHGHPAPFSGPINARSGSSRPSRSYLHAHFRQTHQAPSQALWTRHGRTARTKRATGPPPIFIPSAEQQAIARLCHDRNVVVSARPGSGKTAAAQAIVGAHPDKGILVLTYSKRLQLETSRRLKAYTKCKVLTFHAMARKLFDTDISNDTKLAKQVRQVLETGRLPCWNGERYDIIVLDEFQDCTPQILWLVQCFIAANNAKGNNTHAARLVVLGDERQSIYEHQGAEERFITLAPELFGPVSPYPFARVPLSQSFRLSEQTVDFVNRVFFPLEDEPYMTSTKSGPSPIFLQRNVFDTSSLIDELLPLIKQYEPRNSAIIAPSIRTNNGPVQKLANELSKKCHVPIAVSIDDERPLDDDVIRGKLCVSSIHQFKGSERDLTILFGLDNSYFRYFGRGLPDDKCPNAVFVALTRAAKQLVLVHHEKQELMPFISVEALKETAEVRILKGRKAHIAGPEKLLQAVTIDSELPDGPVCESKSVTALTRHIRHDLLDSIIDRHVDVQQVSAPLPKEQHIHVKIVVPTDKRKKFFEDVSDINGLVFVAAFEHLKTGTIKAFSDRKDTERGEANIPDPESAEYPSWLCRKACDYEAKQSGYQPRRIQMKHHKFDWISPRKLARARQRLQAEVSGHEENLIFEHPCQRTLLLSRPERSSGVGISDGIREMTISGRADIVAVYDPRTSSARPDGDRRNDSIWEIKFVSELSYQHVLQACIYAYLLATETKSESQSESRSESGSESGSESETETETKTERVPSIVLFNVRTGEKWAIAPKNGLEGLRLVVEEALEAKSLAHDRMQDDEFLEMCAKITHEVLSLKR